jgi:hypothetical protein
MRFREKIDSFSQVSSQRMDKNEKKRSEDRSAHEARSAGAGLGGGADSDTQNV